MGVPRKRQQQLASGLPTNQAFVDLFSTCQHGLHGINKHLKAMRSLYDKMSIDEFFAGFIHCVKYAMVVYKREPTAERVIEFATRFVVSLSQPSAQADSNGAGIVAPTENMLLDRIFNFLLQVHGAQEKAVRFRCCQLVSKLLGAMGEDAQIDDELYEHLYEAMLLRMRDKSYAVRVQAIQALSRLQDPTNKDCPIVKAYLFLMTCDPNPDVRRTALSVIAVSRKTLHAIMERTRDTKEAVRRIAFMVLNDKVGVKALSIAQRIDLLQAGLTDRSESVRTVCGQRLLPSWVRSFKGSILELLQGLDVENSSETCDLAMSVLLAKTAPEDIVSAFNLVNTRQVIDISQLTCESVFYWRAVCSHFHKLGPAGDVFLEKLLPTASAFVAYIKTIFAEFSCATDVGIEKQLSNDFILQQLFNMVKILDLTDEAGRKEALKLLIHVLKYERTASSLLKPLMECLAVVVGNPEHRAREVCELIAEIREPTELVEEMISRDERHQLELKLAGVRVAMLRAREELEEYVQKQLYEEAAKIKAKISQLETDKADIMQQMQPRLKEHRRAESDSASTLLRSIAIIGEYLVAPDVEQLSSGIRMSVDELILPGIQNEDPAVRNSAVRALALVCNMDADLARKHCLLFMQAAQIDQEEVKVTALTALFDLILAFGVENFQITDPAKGNRTAGSDEHDEEEDYADSNTDGTDGPDDVPAPNTSGNSIIKIFMTLLNNECADVRTVAAEGLAKLLLSGRLVSPKVLSRLLLLWYNPLTEDDARLRHCLGAFFPMFAFASRVNQELYERAFLPTLQTIFDAPNSSPLASIDAVNVAELLVQLTSARHLVGSAANSQSSPVHDSLAFKLCDEILRAPNSLGVRVLTRALAELQLSLADEVLSKGFGVLLDDMLQVVKEKQSAKLLIRLKEKLDAVRAEQAKSNAENVRPAGPAATEPEDQETDVTQSKEQDESIIQEPVASFLTEPNLNRNRLSGSRARQQQRQGRKLTNTTIGNRSPGDDVTNVTLLADASVEATPTLASQMTQNKNSAPRPPSPVERLENGSHTADQGQETSSGPPTSVVADTPRQPAGKQPRATGRSTVKKATAKSRGVAAAVADSTPVVNTPVVVNRLLVDAPAEPLSTARSSRKRLAEPEASSSSASPAHSTRGTRAASVKATPAVQPAASGETPVSENRRGRTRSGTAEPDVNSDSGTPARGTRPVAAASATGGRSAVRSRKAH